MNKRHSAFIFFAMIFFSCVSMASEFDKHGQRYFLELNGEMLVDGSRVYMRYDLSISENQSNAVIKLTTWHAPISCEGDYKMEKNKDGYALNYLGDSTECIYPAPQFYIKKKGDDMYIKGEQLVYGKGEWLRLSRGKK